VGRLLAAVDGRGLHFWDPATGASARASLTPADGVMAFAFAPGGKLLATAGKHAGKDDRYAIRLWDVATGRELRQLVEHQLPVSQLGFTADGCSLVSSSVDEDRRGHKLLGCVWVWDVT